MTKRITFEEFPPYGDMAELVNKFRADLIAHGFAFGALYVARATDHQSFFLLPQEMKPKMRLEMMQDIAQASCDLCVLLQRQLHEMGIPRPSM